MLGFIFAIFSSNSREGENPSPTPVESVFRILEHDHERATPGLILVYPIRPRVYLVTKEGNVAHEWNLKQIPLFKGQKVELFHVEPTEEGSIIATLKDVGIARISWDNELEWFVPGRFHHDCAVTSSGAVMALARDVASVDFGDRSGEVLADFVVTIGTDGTVLARKNLTQLVSALIPKESVTKAFEHVERFRGEQKAFGNDSPSDLLHTNSMELFEGPLAGAQGGGVLFSFRALDTVAVTDLKLRGVLWKYSGGLSQQHDASRTDSAEVLVFDNGRDRKRSRIITIDPATNEVSWEYDGGDSDRFFAHKRGGAQRLSKGNTLITISFPGELREVTADGDVVWRAETSKEVFGGSIYRALQLDFPELFLKRYSPE
ncbi:MAG: hypothetical protein KDD70_18560 [Bdellovibrionales bacterium]|nr:hypothetical protein [Bdellovibrionales bacterium]